MKKKIADILINGRYLTRNLTILTTLSFTTSDYNNITDNDTISFTIEYYISGKPNKEFTFTYPLHKLYLQTINLFKTIRYGTAYLNKLSIYLTSTFPIKLREPSTEIAKYAKTFIYVVGI